MVRGYGRRGLDRHGDVPHQRDPNLGNLVRVSGGARDPKQDPNRIQLRRVTDPAPRDSPLRDLARGSATIGVGDQDQFGRD